MADDEKGDHGWHPYKFVVRHYRRGDLLDGEAFVLVPERDPAAVAAIVRYAEATPDDALADRLRDWLRTLGHGDAPERLDPDDRVPGWAATLADAVRAGTMTPELALVRMAALVRRQGG